MVSEKLIRNFVPAQEPEQGKVYKHHIADEQEFDLRLKEKLVEEASEVSKASTNQELATELGDLLEVAQEMAKSRGIRWEDVLVAQDAKRKAKGDFSGRIISKT
jgi:predicted house-cleaning noncanonical NTP pyrophosphatase (MazG superfamily)